MSSRYSKRHYEDVARILAEEKHFQETSGRPEGLSAAGSVLNLIHTFADLFAADNPPTCIQCGDEAGIISVCTCGCGGHHIVRGFDREQFLAACGLEPETNTCPLCGKSSPNGEVHKDCADYEQGYSDYVAEKMSGELR